MIATEEIVLTSRRRWSDDEKRSLLSDLSASGLSVSEFARLRGLSRDLLFRWRRGERDRITSTNVATGFVPLALPAPGGGVDRGIEIVLASGVRLVVGERSNLALLKRVIAVLA